MSPHRELKEELLVDRSVSRLLVPSMKELVDAMVWANGHVEAATAELWVGPFLLEVRLSALYTPEREYLSRRLWRYCWPGDRDRLTAYGS